MKFVFIFICFFSFLEFANGMSCKFTHELLLKCVNGRCDKALILNKKVSTYYCDRIYDIRSSDKFISFNEELGSLKEKKFKNGYYLLKCHSSAYHSRFHFKFSKNQLYVECITYKENPKLIDESLSSFQYADEPLEISSFDHETVTEENIKFKLKEISEKENLKGLIIEFSIPVFISAIIFFLIRKNRKHEILLAGILFLLSSFGIFGGLFGIRIWAIFGLIGYLAILFFLIFKTLKKFKKV